MTSAARKPRDSTARRAAATPAWARGPAFGRLHRAFAVDAWTPAARGASGARGVIARAARVTAMAARGFTTNQAVLRAAALTYITVLSIVPTLGLVFAIAKGFGVYDKVQDEVIRPFLDRTFGPEPAAPALAAADNAVKSLEVRRALDQILTFVRETDVSTLGVLGLVVLVWTLVKLLGSVEHSFNVVWRAARARRWIRKVTDYLAIAVVAPIVLGTAAALTTAPQLRALVAFAEARLGLGALFGFILTLTPFLVLWVGFAFFYVTLPNARVRFSSALIGALVAALAWEAFLLLHIHFQVGIARINPVYASFAAIPIFLVWVNVSWCVVLAGAEVASAHQREPAERGVAPVEPSTAFSRELAGLRALVRIGRAFVNGQPGPSTPELARELGVDNDDLEGPLRALQDARLIAFVPNEGGGAWLPSRDPGSIALRAARAALSAETVIDELPTADPRDAGLARALRALREDEERSRGNVTLRELCADEPRAAGEVAGGREVGAERLAPRPS